ncbi:hypothetical protein ACIREM_10230 [Streptomyces shenzhenensis]|uniref:hypothetical protein n=1 Tax=Streptomyces shenzhenensis TaxID=943815 RepID=UPI00380ABB51
MDALDGVEEILEGVEITMLLSDLASCHVPVLKFSFTATPDDEHGDVVIPFQRHPGTGLGSAIRGRLLDATCDPAKLQAFLVLGEPRLEPLRQLDRNTPIFSGLPHG